MSRFSVMIFTISILLISCNKDDTSPQGQQVVEDNFFALKVGNSWIYNFFKPNNSTGVLENVGVQVEVEVIGETTIMENRYYTIQTTTIGNDNFECTLCEENGVSTLQVRDSLGYLIDGSGNILFSSENTQDYLVASYGWGDVYKVLRENEVLVTVPAGQFSCLLNEKYAINPDGDLFDGRALQYFSEGGGEIKRTFVAVTSGRLFFEKQLMSFNIN